MSGICDTCRRKRPCPAEGEGLRRCDLYVSGETRYERLFGTPERAARTLQPDSMSCKYCLLKDYCKDGICLIDDYDALLEWLRGDAE